MLTSEKLFKKNVFEFSGNFIAQDSFWLGTSEIRDELSGDFRIFRNSHIFKKLKNKFLLNRFLKVQIFLKATDLNRSFLQS